MTGIENKDTDLLCMELRALARLSREEQVRHAWLYPDLFPELHFAICQLRDAVVTHFDNERALRLPLIHKVAEGVPGAALELGRLVPELRAERCHILDLLASIKSITRVRPLKSDSPLLRMLLSTLRRIDRDLHAVFAREERDFVAPVIDLKDVPTTSCVV